VYRNTSRSDNVLLISGTSQGIHGPGSSQIEIHCPALSQEQPERAQMFALQLHVLFPLWDIGRGMMIKKVRKGKQEIFDQSAKLREPTATQKTSSRRDSRFREPTVVM
jgi:hypothetical protein